MRKDVLLALSVCGVLSGKSPLAAQSGPAEHWLISFTVPGRPDTVLVSARLRWKGDSLYGNLHNYERIRGTTHGRDVELVWTTMGHPIRTVAARRIDPGTIVGTWSTPGARRSAFPIGVLIGSGTWRAKRVLGASADVAMRSSPYERWTIAIPSWEGDSIHHLRLQWKGDSVTGRIGPEDGVLVGAKRDSSVRFLWLDNSGFAAYLTGAFIGRGRMRGPPPTGGPQRGVWHAELDSVRRGVRSITYSPTETISSFSAANAPGLRIVAGDTVRVRGLRGRGAAAPVYVEGAYQGDVLVVRILSMRPSQGTATMGSQLDINWLTPQLLRAIPEAAYSPVTWTLDTLAGVARLDPAMPRLGALRVPMRMHIGMIGVAPAAQSVMSAGEEGAHGGNLDFSALGPGATIYLPVSHAGGLLTVGGDVHAAQGDGELALNGLETNADIDYTVEVLEGHALDWIRAENSTHLIAFGSSEDLNVALRLAVAHLVEWLTVDFGLDERETAVLLGAAAELNVANVYGTQRTIVARIPKTLLPARR